jgi:hypothetical protein
MSPEAADASLLPGSRLACVALNQFLESGLGADRVEVAVLGSPGFAYNSLSLPARATVWHGSDICSPRSSPAHNAGENSGHRRYCCTGDRGASTSNR